MESKYHFDLIWEKLEPFLQRTARPRLGYHDSQDCIYEYAYYIWQRLEATPDAWNDEEHVVAYFRGIFKYRIRNYFRRLRRYNAMRDSYGAENKGRFVEVDAGWLDICLLGETVHLGKELKMHLDGYSMSEIGLAVGCSKATVSRRISDKLATIRFMITEELRKTSSERIEDGEVAVDLRNLVDFPDTIDQWIAMCGGPGYCLGGSGQKVSYGRSFRATYHTRLVKAMGRISTPNAKRLAKTLGLYSQVGWRKR
jgi:DNA-directed RNA polymerase specialized sigma24 family protein